MQQYTGFAMQSNERERERKKSEERTIKQIPNTETITEKLVQRENFQTNEKCKRIE